MRRGWRAFALFLLVLPGTAVLERPLDAQNRTVAADSVKRADSLAQRRELDRQAHERLRQLLNEANAYHRAGDRRMEGVRLRQAGNVYLRELNVLDSALTLYQRGAVWRTVQTGLGNLTQAEGTVGLQRTFLAKRARSVLLSLWSVSDRATELLMRGAVSALLCLTPSVSATIARLIAANGLANAHRCIARAFRSPFPSSTAGPNAAAGSPPDRCRLDVVATSH